MKTRRRNLSGYLSSTTGSNKRSMTSENGRDNSLPFPVDLVLEIFSRLPVKSIAICRCVSKRRGLDRGLVGLTSRWIGKGRVPSVHVPVICNPSTGQSLPLPRVKTKRVKSRSLFGYDPIDKHVKVLSMSVSQGSVLPVAEEYQVVTLGTGKLSQRMINCGRELELRYWPHIRGRCINGVLYYPSMDMSTESHVFGKQEWSEHVYVLPALWEDIVGSASLSFLVMTQTNEIVMRSLAYPPSPLYLFYFNTERNTVVRVAIKGMDVSEYDRVHIFLDHLENVKLLGWKRQLITISNRCHHGDILEAAGEVNSDMSVRFEDLVLRPKLLLAYKKGGELFFFSAPQPQNPDASSSPVVATYHMKLSFDAYFRRNSGFQISGLDQGLVGLTDQWFLRGSKYSAPVICNPSTGQLFGYDPIDKQVKVLSLSGEPNMVSEEYQIMTLGMGKLFQRMINCGRFLLCNPHFKGICINGVLYYPSVDFPRGTYLLVCFDVRSEKLTFINDDNFIIMVGTMINYNGKLGFLLSVKSDYVDESSTSVNLWVLEDIEKQEWSEHIYVLPHLWKDIVGRASLSFVGMTRANEIVMQPLAYPPTPLYLIYFNIERNTVVRVAIQGMDGSGCAHVKIFLDHVENVKL
uniref:F-box domain-containing protein n=1 Tax=Brassica oleracea var. oleracea TaxID=109376 RepID=A0A0D3C3L6_BRAOL